MPLSNFIHVPRTDPIYNAHGYLTKIPIGAILPFIEEFTQSGDLVVDCFAGSGMTAVAALMSGRRAEVSDISVLGQHIGRGFLSTVSVSKFETVAADVIKATRKDVASLYQTIRQEDGIEFEWSRTIWSFVFRCPSCLTDMVFYKAVLGTGKSRPKNCTHCGLTFKKRNWKCVNDIPVTVVLKGVEGKLTEQPIQEIDQIRITQAQKERKLNKIPSLDISPKREMSRRSALKRWGLSRTQDFFTARNALVLHALWKHIHKVHDESIRQKLLFGFTAILPRASRRYQWGPKRPMNAQNQTYYISAVHYEWNVFELFGRKVRATIRAQLYRDNIYQEKKFSWLNGINYRIASANALNHLKNDSVDYVFTDPPFGSNIFYSDMTLFQEAWLDDVTKHHQEAVIHTGGKQKHKAVKRYETLLTEAFCETYRILRPGGHLSVVFGNSKGPIWSIVIRAIRKAGFEPSPVHLALLDKGQRSIKGLTSGREKVVTIDLILTVKKPAENSTDQQKQQSQMISRKELLYNAILTLPLNKKKNPSYIYVATIKEAIAIHRHVDDLHLADILVELASQGNSIDPKTGLFMDPVHVTFEKRIC